MNSEENKDKTLDLYNGENHKSFVYFFFGVLDLGTLFGKLVQPK